MPLPRVRFTVRRMMVATAIAAVLLGTWRRWAARSAMADYHGTSIASYSFMITNSGVVSAIRDRNGNLMSSAKSDWHNSLATKYRKAAWMPWLPIAPDPPEPE